MKTIFLLSVLCLDVASVGAQKLLLGLKSNKQDPKFQCSSMTECWTCADNDCYWTGSACQATSEDHDLTDVTSCPTYPEYYKDILKCVADYPAAAGSCLDDSGVVSGFCSSDNCKAFIQCLSNALNKYDGQVCTTDEDGAIEECDYAAWKSTCKAIVPSTCNSEVCTSSDERCSTLTECWACAENDCYWTGTACQGASATHEATSLLTCPSYPKFFQAMMRCLADHPTGLECLTDDGLVSSFCSSSECKGFVKCWASAQKKYDGQNCTTNDIGVVEKCDYAAWQEQCKATVTESCSDDVCGTSDASCVGSLSIVGLTLSAVMWLLDGFMF